MSISEGLKHPIHHMDGDSIRTQGDFRDHGAIYSLKSRVLHHNGDVDL